MAAHQGHPGRRFHIVAPGAHRVHHTRHAGRKQAAAAYSGKPGVQLDCVFAGGEETESPAPQNTGVLGTGKQQVKDAIQGQIERAKNISDMVRGPNKMERVEDYLLAKLPYHPQYVRRGTRFDAELLDPLSFGSAPVPPGSLALVGTQPPADSVAHARLITPLNSFSSKPGQMVVAVLAEPVFSADRKLILPEGTHLEGT